MEIAEYANRIAGITDMDLFERHGEPVREKMFKSTEMALDEIFKTWLRDSERLETGAVIFMTEKEAEAAAIYLKRKLEEERRSRGIPCLILTGTAVSFERTDSHYVLSGKGAGIRQSIRCVC